MKLNNPAPTGAFSNQNNLTILVKLFPRQYITSEILEVLDIL